MPRVSATTIRLFLETGLLLTTKRIMRVFRILIAFSRKRVIIGRTILLAAGPAPGSATPLAHMIRIVFIQTTGKDIGTSRILQAPSGAPRTLLRIVQTHCLGLRVFLVVDFRFVARFVPPIPVRSPRTRMSFVPSRTPASLSVI